MSHWFGSSGIRGSFKDISPFFAINLGIASRNAFNKSKMVYIGSDVRNTSEVLKSSFSSGFCYDSGYVMDIGLCPTPVISYLSRIHNTLGIMVTASHNPPSNNGFKFFMNGKECGKDFEKKVEKRLNSLFKSNKIIQNWKIVGSVTHNESKDYINHYIDHLLKKIFIKNSDIKIILDCANNVPNLVSPLILQKLGYTQLFILNDSLNGFFPGRPSEPTSENLTILKKSVIEKRANIGIAHDGDGDRFAIIDEKGNFVNSTTIINFFLDHLDYSDPERRKIILTSDCTNQAFSIAEKKGAKIIINRIGRNRDYVNDNEVLFLAEPNKLIFPEFGRWIDGLFPILKFLEISGSRKTSEVFAPYDKRKIKRKAFPITEKEKIKVNEMIKDLVNLWSSKIIKISTKDGLKLFLKDNSNILIRFSGTEPKIKFYIESDSENKNNEILKLLKTEFNLNTLAVDC